MRQRTSSRARPAPAGGSSTAEPDPVVPILCAQTPEALAQLLLEAIHQCGIDAGALAWRESTEWRFVPQDQRTPARLAALGNGDGALAVPPAPGAGLPGADACLLPREGAAFPPFTRSQNRLLIHAGQRLRELIDHRHLRDAVSQLAHSEQLQRALFAIADMAGSDRDMPCLLRGLHEIIGQLMYAENFFIALYSPERDTLRFVYFADQEDPGMYDPEAELPAAKMGSSLTLGLIRHGRMVHGSAREVAELLAVPGGIGLGTPAVDFIGVPMTRAGQTVGAIVVQTYRPGERYTSSDCAVLSFVAEHVLNAVERKQGQQELERRVIDRTRQLAEANQVLQHQIAERERAEHLQATLYRIAALTSAEDTAERFYRHIHLAVGELLNADNFYIALLTDDGATLEFPYYVDDMLQGREARPFGRGLSEYVIRTGIPLLADRARMEALIASGEFDYSAAYGQLSQYWLGVPLMGKDGVMGVVVVQSYRADLAYDADDAELLTFVSSQIASSLLRRAQAEALRELNAELEQRVHSRTRELREQIRVREQIEAQLKHQVMHDALTGLPNRLYLRDRLERAIAGMRRHPGRRFALMYLDVDRFKLFNDSLGHLAGDRVLREVARRLTHCVREPDVVARLSGDEFAILLEECTTPQGACKVAQRIQRRLGMPMQVGDRELQLSASIGIAISEPRHGSTDMLLHDADVALYRAKAAGRQRFVLYDDSLQQTAMDVLDIERQLRSALLLGEFRAHFQPIVRLDDGGTTGYEALLRWEHPQRGLLAPGEFLPVAEESGLIEDIDWHMYRLACEAGAALVRDGGFITLNISPRHFQNEDFDRRLLALAAQTGFDPARLRIEVTEGTLLGKPEAVARILTRLREAGVEAALDDFGTGYSSLGYVHRFPLKMIKIDRSFVAPLGGDGAQRSMAIIEAVIALSRSLGIEVVAEGIETPAQHNALVGMGCTFGQGYLFGRPRGAACWQD